MENTKSISPQDAIEVRKLLGRAKLYPEVAGRVGIKRNNVYNQLQYTRLDSEMDEALYDAIVQELTTFRDRITAIVEKLENQPSKSVV